MEDARLKINKLARTSHDANCKVSKVARTSHSMLTMQKSRISKIAKTFHQISTFKQAKMSICCGRVAKIENERPESSN